MSKKRTSAESNEDDQTNEGSESLEQRKGNNKRARFDSVSDTTLEDLPIELLECILLKVVVMEVKSLKLAKSVWEEKVVLVISQLRTICSQWDNILSTNSFRKKLQRTLDADRQVIRLEIVHESTTLKRGVSKLASLKDDIFMLSSVEVPYKHYIVEVYGRSNMAEVKDVILLPGSNPYLMRGCNVSNCVYVLIQINNVMSFLRIYKDTEDTFNVAPWEFDHKLPISKLTVSANGDLLILSLQQQPEPHLVSIYNADGSLQHRIKLPQGIGPIANEDIVQKSNGNLVVGYANLLNCEERLLEIDTKGNVLREYKTSLGVWNFLHFADIYGRIVLTKPFQGLKLLDSELNLLGTYSLQQDEEKTHCVLDSHYDSKRNEIVRIHYDMNTHNMVLTIFRFTEE